MSETHRTVGQRPPEPAEEAREEVRIRQAVAFPGGDGASGVATNVVTGVFVPQPARPEPAVGPEAGTVSRSRRRTRLQRPTPAPAPALVENGDDHEGASSREATGAAPTVAAPVGADAPVPPAPPGRTATGGSGGRPLIAAAAIAGAVLVSVPLAVSERTSDNGPETLTVGDVRALPAATLGEPDPTWPSPQGEVGDLGEETSRISGQPSVVLPPAERATGQNRAETPAYSPPVIAPAGEKADERATVAGLPAARIPAPSAPVADGEKDGEAAHRLLPTGARGGRNSTPAHVDSGDRRSDARPAFTRKPVSRPTAVRAVTEKETPGGQDTSRQQEARSAATERPKSAKPVRSQVAAATPKPTPTTKTSAAKPAAAARPKPKPKPKPKPASVVAPARTAPAAVQTTRVRPQKPAEPAQTLAVTATRVLERGQSVSTNRMSLRMQGNGNLVVFDAKGRARWSSGTAGRGVRAVFQDDGNFVVYDGANQPVWWSGTARHPGARLVLQNDGNLTIVSANGQTLWASGTRN
ncbi:hypothetical protein [Streptomyces sp. NPDC058955]|uniref:hypothetical protein n=1 Tax=unclassified Streptomyces TaxID=2593676 RepID=UPI003648EBF8